MVAALLLDPVAQRADPSSWLHCPFTPAVHPLARQFHERSVAWAARMGLVTTEKRREKLAGARIGELVARGFPSGDPEAIQVCSDWTVLFFALDDVVEKIQGCTRARQALDAILAAACGTRSTTEDPLIRAMLEIRERLEARADAAWLARFGDEVERLFQGFEHESVNRAQRHTPDVTSYFTLRRATIGLSVLFTFFDLVHGMPLPDEVRRHPFLEALTFRACNIVGWANDVCTYEKELEEGEPHNLVMVLRAWEGLALDDAVTRAVALHDAEVRAFERELHTLDDGDPVATTYAGMLRAWVRGHIDWASETGRYRPRARQGV